MSEMNPERWRQIRSIFDRVLEAAPDRRGNLLDEICADDDVLRDQVASLLAADDAPARVFESAFDEMAEALAPEDADLQRVVGPYRIRERIGTGGMGVVYLAERADGEFQKQFALKLVKRGMDTEEILRRFRTERQILADLQHPNIAQLTDGGMSEDGRPYLVMEFVAGTPIDQYCDERSLTVDDRLHLFEWVLEAVQYAHQNLVVHRDIKPSNIVVTEDGTVKLLDFGIAKLLSTEEDGLTRTGVRVMTPEYAAPEQRAGGRVTTATDIFALGAVLYELLTGHRPRDLTGESAEIGVVVRPSEAVLRVRRAPHAQDASTDLSSHALASFRGTTADRLRRKLRGDLDNIVLKALREEPDRRYASAEAFLADIRRYRDRLPVQARPDTLGYRAGKFVKRHRYGVAAAVAFAALLIGFAIVSGVQRAATARERDRAEMERDKSEEVAEFLTGLFNASDPFGSPSERLDTLRVRDLLDRGADRVLQGLQDEPVVQAQMLNVIGNVYTSLGVYDRADSLLARAYDIRSRNLGEGHRDAAESLQSLGRLNLAKGEYRAAQDQFQRAASILTTSAGPEALATAEALSGLGAALRFRSEYDRAEEVLRSALQIQKAHLGDDHLDVASSMLELGRVYQDRGSPAVAESLYREVVQVHRVLLGDGHPQVAMSLDQLASVLRHQTRLEEAEPFVREALGIRKEVLGPEHPQTVSSMYELASLARDRGNYEEAVTLFQRVAELDRKTLGERHHFVGLDFRELGITYARMKNYEAALEAYDSALEILRSVLPDGHMDISVVVNGIGYTYLQMGDPWRAEPVLRAALQMRIRGQGEDSWQTGVSKSVLGECLMAQGRHEEAENLLVTGLDTLLKAKGPTEAALRRLVAFYEKVGDEERANSYRRMLHESSA